MPLCKKLSFLPTLGHPVLNGILSRIFLVIVPIPFCLCKKWFCYMRLYQYKIAIQLNGLVLKSHELTQAIWLDLDLLWFVLQIFY